MWKVKLIKLNLYGLDVCLLMKKTGYEQMIFVMVSLRFIIVIIKRENTVICKLFESKIRCHRVGVTFTTIHKPSKKAAQRKKYFLKMLITVHSTQWLKK